MMAFLRRCWIVLDVALNVLGFGRVETISSRCGRQINAGHPCKVCCFICWLLDWRWKDHCKNNVVTPLDKE